MSFMRIDNRQARFDYEIIEKFEAGIDLLGPEARSVRAGQVSLNGSFVHMRDGQAYLVNAHIHPYQNSLENVSPTRSRRLLMHKKELLSLASKVATMGLTLVPLTMYNKGNLFKLEIALAKGKKKWDKRVAIKKKTMDREIDIALRGKE